MLSRPAVLRALALPRLAAALACDATATRVRLNRSFDLVIEDLVLQPDGASISQNEFLSADRATFNVRWLRLLLSGGASTTVIDAIELEKPLLRIAHNVETGELNLDAFFNRASPRATTSASQLKLPAITVRSGRLIAGETRTGSSFLELIDIPVNGVLTPDSDAPNRYTIRLESLELDTDSPTLLDGWFDLASSSVEIKFDRIALEQFSPSASSAARSLWGQFRISGPLTNAIFKYNPEDGPFAELSLEGVDVDLPVPAPDGATPDERIEMRSVQGEVKLTSRGIVASLNGEVVDFPTHVDFTTEGLDPNAPFVCEIKTDEFIVAERPELLPYAPQSVREFFREYSGPTARVNGKVVISRLRAVDGQDVATIDTSGLLEFTNGAAAHELIPYPVSSIAGRIRFRDERITFERLTGVGPTGARMLVSGWVDVSQTPAAHTDITFIDVPVDAELKRVIPPAYVEFIDRIFHMPAHNQLRQAGLVNSADDLTRLQNEISAMQAEIDELIAADEDAMRRVELERRRDALRKHLNRPVFTPGGMCSIEILLRQEPGTDTTTLVRVTFDEVRLLPADFPYPLIARGLTINITKDQVAVECNDLRGLYSEPGRAALSLSLADSEIIDIYATAEVAKLAVDDLLLRAILTSTADMNASEALGEALAQLRLAGQVSGSLSLAIAADKPTLNLNLELAEVRIAAASAHAENEQPIASNLNGPIHLHDGLFTFGPIIGSIGADAKCVVTGEMPLSRKDDATLAQFQIDVQGLNLNDPIETLVRLGNPLRAEQLARWRARYDPAGSIHLSTRLVRDASEHWTSRTEISSLADVSINLDTQRITMSSEGGRLVIENERLEALDLQLALPGAPESPQQLLTINGAARLVDRKSLDFSFIARDIQIKSPLVRAGLRLADVQASANAHVDRQVAGVLDADFQVVRSTDAASVEFIGEIRPRSLAFNSGAERIEIPFISGALQLAPGQVGLHAINLHAPLWQATLNGTLTTNPQSSADISISAIADQLSEDILALLPEEAIEPLEGLKLAMPEGFTLSNARLTYEKYEAALEPTVAFTGDLEFANVSIDPATPITELAGNAHLAITQTASDRWPEVAIDIDAQRAAVEGVIVTNMHTRVEQSPDTGVLKLPSLTANVAEGTLTGSLTIWQPSVAENLEGPARSAFNLDLRLSDANSSAIIASFADDASSDTPPANAVRQGELDAILSLSGRIDDDESLLGRGRVTLEDTQVVRMPLLTRIVELSKLQPPVGDALASADASFFIRGSTLRFDKLTASSNTIDVLGSGTMSLPDLALDLRFSTRGRRRIPLISEVFDALSDEVVTVTVTGSLADPRFGAKHLSKTSELFEGVFSPEAEKKNDPAPPQPK